MSTGKISDAIKEISVKGDVGANPSLELCATERRVVVETNALLPPASEGEAYEKLYPGAVKEIFRLSGEQSEHRREMERQESERKNERRRLETKALENEIALQSLVVLSTLLFCAFLFVCAVIFLFQGKLAESGVALAVPTLGVLAALIRSVFRAKSEKKNENDVSSFKDAA